MNEPHPRRPIGPVGRYAGAVTVIAALLGLLWWSGAVQPRAQLDRGGHGLQTQGRTAWEVRELVNPGPLPVEVRSLGWTPTGLVDPQVRTSARPLDDSIDALQHSRRDGSTFHAGEQPLRPGRMAGQRVGQSLLRSLRQTAHRLEDRAPYLRGSLTDQHRRQTLPIEPRPFLRGEDRD